MNNVNNFDQSEFINMMIKRIRQEKLSRDMLNNLLHDSSKLNDKHRLGIAKLIAATLCEFIRKNAIDLHESGVKLNQASRKPALNMANDIRNFAMDQLNMDQDKPRIIISGFRDRPRDPYAFRVMDVELEP